MEKVMILGAGPLQVPAIRKANELEMETFVCDYNPKAVGFAIAKHPLLISTINQEKILEKAREIKPNYIITSTSDAPVRVASYVSEQLGLPTGISYRDAQCATIKSLMRDRLKEFHVPIPEYFVCSNYKQFEKALDYFVDTCIVKPSDSAASRGVMQYKLGMNKEQVYDYCRSVSQNGVVMVEELMDGPEVSVECFVVNKEVDIIAITDKLVTPLPFFVELGHSEQSMLSEDIKASIKEITKEAIRAIGIVNGVSHTEIKVTKHGPKIVEIAARLGGDYITSKLVPLSTGIDMVGNSILLSLERPIDLKRKYDRGSAIRFITGNKGTIKSIDLSTVAESGEAEIELYKKCAERINQLKSSDDRIGHVITSAEDASKAIKKAEDLLSQIKIEVE